MNVVSDFKCVYADRDINHEIALCKKKFFESPDSVLNCHYLPIEIRDSWLQSKMSGINPYQSFALRQASDYDPDKLSDANKLLLEAAVPLIEKELSHLFHVTGAGLCDRDGMILYSKRAARLNKRQLKIRVGALLLEENAGTLSQTLCLKYHRPVQLFGPIHYHTDFQNDLSVSVPIYDENHQMISVLSLVNDVLDDKAYDDLDSASIHLMGWAKSLAFAIGSQLHLIKKNRTLRMANQILNTTISSMDEGVITVGFDQKIQHINREGAKIFGQEPADIKNKDILHYINNPELFQKVLQQAEAFEDLELNIGEHGVEQRYLLKATPVIGEEQKVGGAVLSLSSLSKVKKMVARRGGNQATYSFNDIVGNSQALSSAVIMAKKISTITSNVLLIGESGTGKELFAQAIHNNSRPDGPFIAINCTSMPRNLIESELFGYEGGAFTGAERKGRIGKIELAHGGTLFLDEIGDMPLEIQPVLLRVLEERKVMRIGGNHYIPVNFRLIAATNQNLFQAVNEKTFREDLYYRLSIFTLNIPPLRDRIEEVELLANYFIEDTCQRLGRSKSKLSKDALRLLKHYHWPGNVRQLQNAMVFATNMAEEGHEITVENLPFEITGTPGNVRVGRAPETPEAATEVISLKIMEKKAIENALLYTNFNMDETARKLGLSRATLYRRIKEYHIAMKE